MSVFLILLDGSHAHVTLDISILSQHFGLLEAFLRTSVLHHIAFFVWDYDSVKDSLHGPVHAQKEEYSEIS